MRVLLSAAMGDAAAAAAVAGDGAGAEMSSFSSDSVLLISM